MFVRWSHAVGTIAASAFVAFAVACGALVDGPGAFSLAAPACAEDTCEDAAPAPVPPPDAPPGAETGPALPAGPDPAASWPMLGHDAAHTSRSPVKASNLKTSRARWALRPGVAPSAAPAVDGSGTVYFTTRAGRLVSVAIDGNIRWTRDLGGTSRCTPALAANGTVYATSTAAGLTAWSRDGTPLWTLRAGGGSHPVIGQDGTVYVVDADVTAVTPAGTVKWTYPIGAPQGVRAEAVAIGDDGVVYAVRDGLHAISPSGKRLFRAADGDGQSPPPVVANGNVYVGSGNRLVAVKSASGERRWELSLLSRRPQASPAVREDGILYFLDGGTLYQLDPVFGTGALPTALSVPRPFAPSIDGHGWAFLVDPDGAEFPLLAYLDNGALLPSTWTVSIGHEVVGFSFGPDGTVFAATGSSTGVEGQLLAIPPP